MVRVWVAAITAAAFINGAPIAAQDTKPPVKEKRICKSSATIGSLVQQRTCHTASEWKELDKANDRAMQDYRRENAPGSNPTPQ